MQLKIPDAHREGLKTLATLPDDSTERLFSTLTEAKPTMSSSGFVKQIAGRVDLPEPTLESIMGALFSLSLTRYHYQVAVEDLARDVVGVVWKQNELDDAAAERFKKLLVRLLQLDYPLGVAARATYVIAQHKNSFLDARIFTDVRPVFSSDDNPRPIATTIVHNLEIKSHTDEQHVTHFFALDENDLRTLKSVVERAIRKEASLKQALLPSDLFWIGPEKR